MRLRATAPDGTVRRVPLAGRVVIGRTPAADLVLGGARVSRRHAAVVARERGALVEDLGSSNGTWLDGQRLAGPVELAPGAAFRIGEWSIALEADATPACPVAPASSRAGPPHGLARPGPPALAAVAVANPAGTSSGTTGPARDAERRNAPAPRARARRIVRGALVAAAALAAVAAVALARRPPAPNVAGEPARNEGGGGASDAGGAGAVGAGRVGAGEAGVGAAGVGAAGVGAGEAGVGEAGVAARVGLGESGAGEAGGGVEGAGVESASARLDRWRVEVAGARLLLAERRTAGDWPGTREAAAHLEALDPLDPAVGAAREALAVEERAAADEARARDEEALGRDEEALARFTAIPRNSWHHGRARDAAVRLIRERLAPASRAECVRLLGRKARAKALPVCRRYLELTCHERLDEPVAAVVRRARRPGEAPWTCPPELGAWLGSGETGADDRSPERAVRERYPEPGIADALLAHLRDGRTRTAREALERLGQGPLAARLEELDGRLVEARARLLAGDLDAAGQALERAGAVEDGLLPGGSGSPALVEARAALATALRERGEEHLARGRDGLAFAAFRRAFAAAPGDPAVRRGLEELESRAAARLDEDGSCEAATVALSLTTPGGTTHRRAEERLAAASCRGVGGF